MRFEKTLSPLSLAKEQSQRRVCSPSIRRSSSELPKNGIISDVNSNSASTTSPSHACCESLSIWTRFMKRHQLTGGIMCDSEPLDCCEQAQKHPTWSSYAKAGACGSQCPPAAPRHAASRGSTHIINDHHPRQLRQSPISCTVLTKSRSKTQTPQGQ